MMNLICLWELFKTQRGGWKMSEFNLKKEREKLFEIMLKQNSTAGRVYRLIRLQDKKFVGKLKLEMHLTWDNNEILNKLAGDEDEN